MCPFVTVISLSIMSPRSIHVNTKAKNPFFLKAEEYSVVDKC